MLKKFIPELIKAPLRSRLHERRLYRSEAGQDLWVFGEVLMKSEMGSSWTLEPMTVWLLAIHTFLKIGLTGEGYASRPTQIHLTYSNEIGDLKEFPFSDYHISCITIERPSR